MDAERPPRLARTALRWGRGDELAMAPPSKGVQTLSWDNSPDAMRRLTFDGHKVFLDLREWDLQRRLALAETADADEELMLGSLPPRPVLDDDENAFLGERSAALRSAFDGCWQRLEADALAGKASPRLAAFPAGEVQDQIQKLKLASSAWHLIDIMCFTPSEVIAGDVAEWVYQHYPRDATPQVAVARELEVRNLGSATDKFWPLVHATLMRGDLLAAWNFLSLDNRFVSARSKREAGVCTPTEEKLFFLFEDVRRLMLEMPRLESYRDSTDAPAPEGAEDDVAAWRSAVIPRDAAREFVSHWQAWRDSLVAFCSEYDFIVAELDRAEASQSTGGAVNSSLRTLLNILQGDMDTMYAQLDQDLDSWQHLVAAVLLFQAPTKRKDAIGALARHFVQLDGETAEPQATPAENRLLVAIFDRDLNKALQLLHTSVGDRFVLAHLAQILALAGVIDTVPPGAPNAVASADVGPSAVFLLGDYEMDLREYFVAQYATSLGLGGRQEQRNAHSATAWRVAADYLASLERLVRVPRVNFGGPGSGMVVLPLGLLYMETIVDRQQPVSDRHCAKLIRGCQMMDLPADVIVRKRVMHWWNFRRCPAKDGSGRRLASALGPGAANALFWATRSPEPGLASRILKKIFASNDVGALDLLVEGLSGNLASMHAAGALDDQALRFLQEYHGLYSALASASALLEQCVSQRASRQELDPPSEDDKLFFSALEHRDQAVGQLCRILEDDVVPRRFYRPLLAKVLLWESSRKFVLTFPPCMTVDQASLLQGCLEEPLEKSQSVSPLETHDLSMLRVILAQGLARAAIVAGLE